MSRHGSLRGLLVCCAFAAVAAAPAKAYVYWGWGTSASPTEHDYVGRATLFGSAGSFVNPITHKHYSGVQPQFVDRSNPQHVTSTDRLPHKLAVNAHAIYWPEKDASSGAWQIRAASLDGSTITTLLTSQPGTGIYAVTATDTHIYWSTWSGTAGNALWGATLDPSGLSASNMQAVIAPQSQFEIVNLANDGAHIYFDHEEGIDAQGHPILINETVGRVNFDGSALEPQRYLFPGAGRVFDLAVSDGYLYKVNDFNSANPYWISRTPTDVPGPAQDPFFMPLPNTDPIAVLGDYVYWRDDYSTAVIPGLPTSPTITRASLDGSQLDPNFLTIPADQRGNPGVGLAADVLGPTPPPRLKAHAVFLYPLRALLQTEHSVKVWVDCQFKSCHTTLSLIGPGNALAGQLTLKLSAGPHIVTVSLSKAGRRAVEAHHGHERLKLVGSVSGIRRPTTVRGVVIAPPSKLALACPAALNVAGDAALSGRLTGPRGLAHRTLRLSLSAPAQSGGALTASTVRTDSSGRFHTTIRLSTPGQWALSITYPGDTAHEPTAAHCPPLDVRAPPTGSFTYQPSALSSGQQVNFDASSSTDPDDQISSYAWNFGDGSSASGKTVSHTFAAPGSYTVTLTVTDRSGLADTATKTVAVASRQVTNPLPDLAVRSIDSAVLGSGPTTPCTITYTLANVGFADAGPSTTHVVLTKSGPGYELDSSSASLAAGTSRQEQITTASARTGCGAGSGTTVTVTANSTGTITEADAGHDTNDVLSQSF